MERDVKKMSTSGLLKIKKIRRCTCVNKRKNSGSRWMLENNITRCPGCLSQLEIGCRSENQLQTEGLWPLVTSGSATQAKMRKKCCYGRGRTWVNIAVRPCLHSFLIHNKHHPFENKVWEIYIHIKKCIPSLLKSSLSVDYIPVYICIRVVYYTTVCWCFLVQDCAQQHPTRHQQYGHLPPIAKTIQVRRARHAGHCWRSRDELIRDVLLWIPTHGRAKAGRPARTYIQQLCEDTGCCPEDLPRAMNDREEWRERVRDIRATSAIWWWWCWCRLSNPREMCSLVLSAYLSNWLHHR